MKASLKWIKEILPNLKVAPAAIEKRFNAVGLEVEGVERQDTALDGVIVGEVKRLVPHPDADKLRIASVFDGEKTHQVVCGAPNVKEGQRVAFAPAGFTLPNGVTLEERKIRGVESSGMICSESELGISDEHEGILVTKPRARAGKPIAQVEALDDVVLELGITPNRPDVLSHFGLARELAAMFQLERPKASVRVRESGGDAKAHAKVSIDDKRCEKFTGRVLLGVKVGPSPVWVKRRLKQLGIRSISNVVDATNIALMELGHPLHAYDLHKVGGARLVARAAEDGEKVTLLDGTVKTLVADDLVIADANGPVGLAGVMGGLDSEVTEATVDILLEAAVFDPKAVRKSARRHGLHTEASHRFERGVDSEMVEVALDRCAQLIVELAGGQVLKGRLVDEKVKRKPIVVPIRPERASMLIGRAFDKKEVKAALTALGLRAVKNPAAGAKDKKKTKKKDRYADAMFFEVPSWRLDLALEEDLIEEVGRLYGYDNIPAVMPPGRKEPFTEAPRRIAERDVRDVLAHEGYAECISLAFDAEKDAEALGLDLSRAVILANPLGEESRVMRMSLVPALLRAARLNQDNLPSLTDLALFEVGKTFVWASPPGELPNEAHRIGLLLRGRRAPISWTQKGTPVDAFDLKGSVEAVLEHYRVDGVKWLPAEVPWLHPRSATRIDKEGRSLGVFGELHPAVAEQYGLEGPPAFVAQLELDAIVKVAGARERFAALPKLPPAQRDLSFFVADEVASDRVLATIRGAAGDHLEAVELFDVYVGKGVPEGKKSLAVALVFRAPDRTLTDREVDGAQAAIIGALERDLHAQVRVG